MQSNTMGGEMCQVDVSLSDNGSEQDEIQNADSTDNYTNNHVIVEIVLNILLTLFIWYLQSDKMTKRIGNKWDNWLGFW